MPGVAATGELHLGHCNVVVSVIAGIFDNEVSKKSTYSIIKLHAIIGIIKSILISVCCINYHALSHPQECNAAPRQ